MIINYLSVPSFIGIEINLNGSLLGSIQDIVINLNTDTFFFMIKPEHSSTKNKSCDLIPVPWEDIIDEEKGYAFNVTSFSS